MKRSRSDLTVLIDGVPPGIRVGIFDERFRKEEPRRELILEEVSGPDHAVRTHIDKKYGGVPVKIVIRRAGFRYYEFRDTIEEGIGLFHAAKLEIDNVYDGPRIILPEGWNPQEAWREAERRVQSEYREFKKDNPRARLTKNLLDYGFMLIGGLTGFFLDPILGTLVGLVLGLVGGKLASSFTSRAMGWE